MLMIRNLTYSDLDSCDPEVVVPDAWVFSSIKNEQKYPWLYHSAVHQLKGIYVSFVVILPHYNNLLLIFLQMYSFVSGAQVPYNWEN
jgi:hypothetical protein